MIPLAKFSIIIFSIASFGAIAQSGGTGSRIDTKYNGGDTTFNGDRNTSAAGSVAHNPSAPVNSSTSVTEGDVEFNGNDNYHGPCSQQVQAEGIYTTDCNMGTTTYNGDENVSIPAAIMQSSE